MRKPNSIAHVGISDQHQRMIFFFFFFFIYFFFFQTESIMSLWINFILAHQTEIATLFAWVIKLHLTQVFSPRLKNTQNLEINQILGVAVQEKESNMVFCSRWKFPTLWSLGSAQHGHPLGWKLPSRTEPHIRFL